MFLRPLNNEQKKLFLGLAQKAAVANGVIEEVESELLDTYADEMGISISDASDLPFEENLKRLKIISNSVQINQMVFEIVGMIMIDMEYDDDEKSYIKKLASILEIDMKIIDEMFEYVSEYSDLVRRINNLMFS